MHDNINQVNQIILTKRDFGNDEALYKELALTLQTLLRANYVCSVEDVDTKSGIIVIHFSSKNPAMGQPQIVWIYPDELPAVQDVHKQYLQSIIDSVQTTDIVTKFLNDNNKKSN